MIKRFLLILILYLIEYDRIRDSKIYLPFKIETLKLKLHEKAKEISNVPLRHSITPSYIHFNHSNHKFSFLPIFLQIQRIDILVQHLK